MRILFEFIALLVFLVPTSFVIAKVANRRKQLPKPTKGPWKMNEAKGSFENEIVVYLYKGDDWGPFWSNATVVKRIPFNREDFTMALEEARVEAEERMLSLNSGRHLNK
jgi:hypothetical protein